MPLTELGEGTYKAESGGLYGEGRNEPSEQWRQAAAAQVAKILPRDDQGNPSPNGKYVLLSVGMSTTHQQFMAFLDQAAKRRDLNRALVLVDGAQGANDARDWADRDHINPRTNMGLWTRVDQKLRDERVTAKQVQAAWINLVHRNPDTHGEFPQHVLDLQESVTDVLHILKERYPNVAVAYLSSRVYAGYSRGDLSPEPYAYEAAFTNRRLIESQQAGNPELNWDPAKGAVRAPLLLWGPYLWADGMKPRAGDGLIWERDDYTRDGIHLQPKGANKAARVMMDFFSSNEMARPWFMGTNP